jgi:hypothetical protein
MLDSRYDDLKSGRVKPIDGEEAFARLKAKTEVRRNRSTWAAATHSTRKPLPTSTTYATIDGEDRPQHPASRPWRIARITICFPS